MIRFIFLIIALLFSGLYAQDLNYAKAIVEKLASEEMHGRGYVNGGDSIAAEFIADEFKKYNLQKWNNTYFQSYSFPINSFPGKLSVSSGNKQFEVAKDFNVNAFSGSINGEKTIFRLKAKKLENINYLLKLSKIDFSDKVIITDNKAKSKLIFNPFNAAALFFEYDKLPAWSVHDGATSYIWFSADVLKKSFKKTKKVHITSENVFHKKHNTRNVIGYIPGYAQKDSFIVITAHYDHLGRMGKDVYFPGANDNASGIAFMLNLAKYYSEKIDSLPYSIAFMAFSGEEAGLLGSFNYVNNPLFPLKNIKLVLNFDMVGTGSEGIKVVNGTKFGDILDKMKKFNDKHKLLTTVSARGESANSDHYPFYDKGVTALFIYTLGKEHTEYHTPNDKAEKLPFTAYNELFRLIAGFLKTI